MIKNETIVLTEVAAKEVKRLLNENNTPDWALRVGVKPGGCSGLEYDLQFAEKPNEDDTLEEIDGIKIVVDSKSILYLDGMTLDYSTDLLNGGFKFVNPNASRSCSCGTSFAV